MNAVKKIGSFLQNCVELYIPAVSFAVLFVLFCFQIIVRYIISKITGLVVPWTVEIEQMCFLWVALLGACYVQRNRGHVVFTLVYDSPKVKGKAILSLISSTLVSFACACTLIPSYKYVWGLMERQQVTSLLKIPKTVVFFPYVIFIFLILAYGLVEVFEAIMVLKGDEYYTNKLLQTTKSEAEQAVDAINTEFNEFLKNRTPEEYEAAVALILGSQAQGGRIHVTGIGKCSHVATYVASLMSSTGNPAYYLHGTEAVHGSCSQLTAGDVVIAISNSGETSELKATVLAVKNNGCKVIGVSGGSESWLAKNTDAFLFAGVKAEGGPMNRAPRNSVLAELLTLQALSVILQQEKEWDPIRYVRCHPGGALGQIRENEK